MKSDTIFTSNSELDEVANTAITRRGALALAAGAGAALIVPGVAFADDEEAVAEAEVEDADATAEVAEEETEEEAVQEIEDFFESWRYSDGQVLAHPDTDAATSEETLNTMATSSTYSTWTKSYGTSYYGIVSSSGTTKVAVSGVKRVGIDVSKWQGSINWSKVAAGGIDFAIIRCGYGSDYESQDDSYFLTNVAGAQKYGVPFGVYLYSYATKASGSAPSAASEATHVLRLLDEAGLEPDDLDLPVFLDLEDEDYTGTCSASTIGSIAETFCTALTASGYAVGIYANKNWWENYLTSSVFTSNDWYKWVARYSAGSKFTSSGVDDTDIWQFSSAGTVSGISGNVDMNFDYVGEGNYESPFDGPIITYRAHCQTYGWSSGTISSSGKLTLGTTGNSKRLEAFQLKISDDEISGSITYRAHVADIGWQSWVTAGKTAGTTGQSKAIQAVQIKLTGDLADAYDLYYRVHSQTYGWLNWTKNGSVAGTTGLSKRAEAVQIALVEKGGSAPGSTTTPYVNKATLSVRAHLQSYGWLSAVASGSTAGKAGSGKRLEALQISMSSKVSGSITYRAHVQNVGWQSWVSDGATAGTTGQSKRLEAVQIKLTGAAASNYTIWYRSYVQGYGWLGWAKGGATSGTTGMSRRIEAVQVKILAKSASAPGSTSKASISK